MSNVTDLDRPRDIVSDEGKSAPPKLTVVGILRPYVSLARPDHWFKNTFMGLGVMLAYLYHPQPPDLGVALRIVVALAAVCVLASSNYVLNEILDAGTDSRHPVKRKRPVPSGRVDLRAAYAEWAVLGFLGLGLAWWVNFPLFMASVLFLLMGLVYNVPPLRSKEYPYVDVLTESLNNPIRLILGWFAVSAIDFPPLSLLVAYWMVGAFLMAAKRLSEWRLLGRPEVAAAYRKSFRFYDENRLLTSMFFYAAACSLCLGAFVIRYHLELILMLPLFAGFFSYYVCVAFKENSVVQRPEHLFREWGLMIYLAICLTSFITLMFVRIGFLYELFHIRHTSLPALWEL